MTAIDGFASADAVALSSEQAYIDQCYAVIKDKLNRLGRPALAADNKSADAVQRQRKDSCNQPPRGAIGVHAVV
ncbi:hypothetical protein [Euzebya pacifica]|uniref:hypothetical protein n=1 Tax=Euzebya pacifica TaxID=1608957 RepID=UPI0030F7EC14